MTGQYLSNPQIILASSSPRRKNLLNQINLKFTTKPSRFDEPEPDYSSEKPEDYAEGLAYQKALMVSRGKKSTLVIGSDTIVVINDEILNKPQSEEDAVAMLKKLSGKTHRVITAVALILTDSLGEIGSETRFHEVTEVTFSRMTDRDIRDYTATGSPLDKAGAYGIQDDWGSIFVEKINGDYYNVVGFPLNRFYRELMNFSPGYLPRP